MLAQRCKSGRLPVEMKGLRLEEEPRIVVGPGASLVGNPPLTRDVGENRGSPTGNPEDNQLGLMNVSAK